MHPAVGHDGWPGSNTGQGGSWKYSAVLGAQVQWRGEELLRTGVPMNPPCTSWGCLQGALPTPALLLAKLHTKALSDSGTEITLRAPKQKAFPHPPLSAELPRNSFFHA